jgi:hypothetical protein
MLYSKPNIVSVIKLWRIRWAGHVAHMGEMKNTYKILVRKPEGKTSQGRPRHRWEDNIRLNLWEIMWEDVNWMHLAEDMGQWQALVNMVMYLQVPHKTGSFLTSWVTISVSSCTLLRGVS